VAQADRGISESNQLLLLVISSVDLIGDAHFEFQETLSGLASASDL
jgi:hypothetical protein